MSSIFGNETSSLNIEEEITLDSSNFINNAQSIPESLLILDNQLYHPPTVNLPQTEHNQCLDFLSNFITNIGDNLTPGEIKLKYEINPDTNAYTDAEKALTATIPNKIEIDVSNLNNYQTTTIVNGLLDTKVNITQLADYTTTVDQNIIDNNLNTLINSKYDSNNPFDYQTITQVLDTIASEIAALPDKTSTEILHSYGGGPPVLGGYIQNELVNDVNFVRTSTPFITTSNNNRPSDLILPITGSASFNEKTMYTTASNTYLINPDNSTTTIPFIVNNIQRCNTDGVEFIGIGNVNTNFVYYAPLSPGFTGSFNTYTFPAPIQYVWNDRFLPGIVVLLNNGDIYSNDYQYADDGGWVLRGSATNTLALFTSRVNEIIFLIAPNGDIYQTPNFISYSLFTNIGPVTSVSQIIELNDNVFIVIFNNGATVNEAKLILDTPNASTVTAVLSETRIVKLQDGLLATLTNNLYNTRTFDITGFNFASDSYPVINLNPKYFRLVYEYTSSISTSIPVAGIDTFNQLETNLAIINNYETINDNNDKLALKYDSSNPENYIDLLALAPYELTTTVDTKLSNYTTLLQYSYLSRPNIKIVAINGSLTPQPGQSYLTIASALAAAAPNQTVFITPGTYNESNLIIPANVSLKGFDKNLCIITYTGVGNIINMPNASSSISDLTINGNNASGTLKAVYITHVSSYINNVNINIIGAGINYGIHNDVSTGSYSETAINLRDTIITTGSRGVLSNNLVGFNIDNCNIVSDIAVDSTAISVITDSMLKGTTADISGANIRLGKSTILLTPSSVNVPQFYGCTCEYLYGHIGNLGSSFLTPMGEDNQEISLRFSKPTLVFGLYFNARVGTTNNVQLVIRKNGVATSLLVNILNTNVASNETDIISFAMGDRLSIQVIRTSGTTTDYNVQLSAY